MKAGPIILPPTAEQEASELLDATAARIADMLGKSIAALPVMVGLGRAPTAAACVAAAEKITEMFAGAVLAAIEGERAAERTNGYIEAFCELCNLLQIGVQPRSLADVWTATVRPRIIALLAKEHSGHAP